MARLSEMTEDEFEDHLAEVESIIGWYTEHMEPHEEPDDTFEKTERFLEAVKNEYYN